MAGSQLRAQLRILAGCEESSLNELAANRRFGHLTESAGRFPDCRLV